MEISFINNGNRFLHIKHWSYYNIADMPDEDKAVGTTPVYIARWGGEWNGSKWYEILKQIEPFCIYPLIDNTSSYIHCKLHSLKAVELVWAQYWVTGILNFKCIGKLTTGVNINTCRTYRVLQSAQGFCILDDKVVNTEQTVVGDKNGIYTSAIFVMHFVLKINSIK